MTLHFNGEGASYGITIGKDILSDAGTLFNLNRKVLIVTDEGVPAQYPGAILSCCRDGSVFTMGQGEGSKTMATVEAILSEMLRLGFTRSDAVVAVGGGVVGDVAGFAAACYQRGIEWYNVPTTLLSQVDSSVGGKTGVNLLGTKNIAGAFHQPSGVLVDTSVLDTLPPRLFAEGMAEMIKMAATSDAELFSLLEITPPCSDMAGFIARALGIKIRVVQADPLEKGERAVLNFGHTIGHAIEAAGAGKYYHGEAVAMGMLYFCQGDVKERLQALLQRYNLPVRTDISPQTIYSYAVRDKKKTASGYKTVWVGPIGTYTFRYIDSEALRAIIEQ